MSMLGVLFPFFMFSGLCNAVIIHCEFGLLLYPGLGVVAESPAVGSCHRLCGLLHRAVKGCFAAGMQWLSPGYV